MGRKLSMDSLRELVDHTNKLVDVTDRKAWVSSAFTLLNAPAAAVSTCRLAVVDRIRVSLVAETLAAETLAELMKLHPLVKLAIAKLESFVVPSRDLRTVFPI